MRRIFAILAVLGALSISMNSFAFTIHVPGDSATIQLGIDGAMSGDTVLVAPGTYYTNIDFSGKSIVVMSEAGPNLTILKPDSSRLPIVAFENGETYLAVLSGFTLSNSSGSGPAVRIVGCSPTVFGNIIKKHSSLPGGQSALFIRDYGSPVIRDNLFYDNADAHIVIWATFINSVTIINNTIHSGGTGLHIQSTPSIIRNNIVTACEKGISGIADIMYEDHNNFWNNTTNTGSGTPDPTTISVNPQYVNSSGGNFHLIWGSPCIDAGNPASQYNDPDGTIGDMGAVYFDQRTPGAVDLHIFSEDGSHVISHIPTFIWTYFDPGSPQAGYEVEVGTDDDWTAAETWASGQVASTDTFCVYAGGILENGYTYYYRVRVSNGTVWGEWKESVFRMNAPPSVPVPISPVDDELQSTYGVQLVVENSIDSENDILTYDFEIYEDQAMTTLAASRSGVAEQVDETNSGIFDELNSSTQYWWRCRVFDKFEYSEWSSLESFITRTPVVIHVPSEQPTIQAGIDAAQERDTVLVAPDAYSGDGNRDLDFRGTNIVLLSESGPEVTIIDCGGTELESHIGLSFQNDENSTSVVEGFTITNASAWYYNDSAAIMCYSSPIIRDCVIKENSCNGIIFYWNSSSQIIDCIIADNESNGIRGGGAFEMSGCLVIGNAENGLYASWGEMAVSNCDFLFNGEKGMYFEGEPPKGSGAILQQPTISNCISAYNQGDGIYQLFWFEGLTFYCTNSFGNGGDDWLTGGGSAGDDKGNISKDPMFCDTASGDFRIYNISSCAPANNSCGVLMGAYDVGCFTFNRTWYVKYDGTGDAPTIQAAIDSATNQDTVLVAAGTYVEDIDFKGKDILVVSEAGPEITRLISFNDSLPVVSFVTAETRSAQLTGFTVMNAHNSGIYCEGSSPTILNNIIVNNRSASSNNGAGIDLNNTHGSLVKGNVFYNNTAHTYGPAIHMENCTDDTICYNVMYANSGYADVRGLSSTANIYNNTISVTTGRGIELRVGGYFEVRNNIIFFAKEQAVYVDGGTIDATYNCTFANAQDYNFTPGVGNIFEDALFSDSLNHDYTLQISSPCIDAGDPDAFYNDADGSRNDMGALPYVTPTAVIRVPADQPTIQAGIDAASSGDTVLVAPDTYRGDGNRDLDFGGKNIVLISESGAAVTIIDCEADYMNPHFGLHFHSDEDSTAVVDGFTIKNAFTDELGAVYVTGSTPTIRNCTITENDCSGIYCAPDWPWPRMIHIENCTISYNSLHGYDAWAAHSLITGCVIEYNDLNGVSIDWSGGIEISNSLIRGNGGTGLYHYTFHEQILVTNCTFVGNNVGLYWDFNYPKKESAESVISSQEDSSGISRCIFAYNRQQGISFGYSVMFEVRCCDAYGNPEGDWVNYDGFGPGDDYGNISEDPLFCDTLVGNFHVLGSSPCAPANNSCGLLMGAFSAGCEDVCGDVDGNGGINIQDVTYLITYLYKNGPPPVNPDMADVDNSGALNILDAAYLINYLYRDGPDPNCQ